MEFKVVFDKALIVSGKEIREVVMSTPTIGVEEDAMDNAIAAGRSENPIAAEAFLYSALTGIPYDVLRTLPSYEYAKLRAAYDTVNRPTAPQAANAQ